MIGSLVKPNLHAALVHYPLALVTIGVLLEILCVLFWRKSALRTAGRWMLVIGILAAIPTLTTGLYALRQTAGITAPQSELWEAVASASSWSEAQWQAVTDHVTYAALGAMLLLAGIVIWIGATDNARRNMYLLGIVVLVVGAGLIGYGAHHGGELVYGFGTGVRMEALPESAISSPGEVDMAMPAEEEDFAVGFSWLEMHLFFAGCAIALVAAAIGLSARLSNVAWENRFAEEKAVASGYRPAGKMGQESNLLAIPVIYPGAFWVAGVLFLLVTVAMGLWVFGVRSAHDLLTLMRSKQVNDEWRPVLHLYGGAALILLALVLGTVMKIWPRRRLIMGMLCTLILIAVAAQSWIGILMLFDGNTGSVLRFNRLPANRPIVLPPLKALPPATRSTESEIRVPAGVHTLETPTPASIPAARVPQPPLEDF